MTPLPVEPCTLALFGALGDLALRKLFPALYQLDRAGLLPDDTRVLALARESGDPAVHLATIAEHLRRHVAERDLDEAVLQRLLARLDYLSMDFRQREDFAALADLAGQAERIVAFFATPA
ncbi:MAG TPA: glucose-6-phosphate dehydrogenase, partial [Pseudomonas sp.]|nr:glucose-6-phosphate dehydrogenase [Pseudomonas sp.]